MNFVPQYDDSVREFYVFRPDVPAVAINPSYCLMPTSAAQLAAILADLKPTIELRDPWPTYGPWRYTHGVPWLVFPDGSARNAALIAGWWTMAQNGNFPLAQAEVFARQDIAGQF